MTRAAAVPQSTIQVGILTKGRPMLATVIANLVLQEELPIEIFIVDTGDQPSIKRVSRESRSGCSVQFLYGRFPQCSCKARSRMLRRFLR